MLRGHGFTRSTKVRTSRQAISDRLLQQSMSLMRSQAAKLRHILADLNRGALNEQQNHTSAHHRCDELDDICRSHITTSSYRYLAFCWLSVPRAIATTIPIPVANLIRP